MKNIFFIKNFSFFICVLTISFLSLSCKQTEYTYLLKADYDPLFPAKLNGHYKGNIINLDGIDILTETELVHSFELIIIAEYPKLSSGTIAHLERDDQVDCIWYKLSWIKEGSKIVWTTQKLAHNEMPTRISNNAIIICFPPEFIEKIEDKAPQDFSSIIHLPTIILKKNLTSDEKKRLNDAQERSIISKIETSSNVTSAHKMIQHGDKVRVARRLSI